jgi:hypothetical protein
MTFTKEQVEALKVLEATFGPFEDANPEHVEPIFVDNYERSVRNYAGYAVDHWKAAVLAADPELPAIKQKIREEKARKAALKNAARSQEIRENLVSGILSGLVPKARKVGSVVFEVTDWNIHLVVKKSLSSEEIFEFSYDRQDFTLDGHLNGEDFESEDWSALNGNARPRDQSVALKTVVEYLEELDSTA